MAVFLVPLETGRPIVLDKAIVLIGRQADCDVVLTNSRRVSRRHCCVAQVNDTYVVRDLGSMNGVRINGRRVDVEARLALGDVLSIGDLGFVLQGRDARSQPRKAFDQTQQLDDRNSLLPPVSDYSQEMPVVVPESRDDFPAADNFVAAGRGPLDVESSDSDDYSGRNSHFELLPD